MHQNMESSLPRRLGMYKNFRVGVIKYFQTGNNSRDSILIEVVEPCYGTDINYFSTYNLIVEFDERYSDMVQYTSVGSWILFGFYIQSFRKGNSFSTILRLRHFEKLDNQGGLVSLTIRDQRTETDREMMVPKMAFDLMNDITNKTQFNEYGTR